MERGIVLKMLSADGKVPEDIFTVLGIQMNQKLLMTLYSDGTIMIEQAPTPKLTKPTAEPIAKIKLAKKKFVGPIPRDWMQIGKSRWLTLDGAINRVVKGKLQFYMSAQKVEQITQLIRDASSKSEATKALMEKLNLSKNTALMYYSIGKRTIPHFDKMKAAPKEFSGTIETT